MVAKPRRHNVFISFHEEDIEYKEEFVRRMSGRIIDKSRTSFSCNRGSNYKKGWQ